jgi:AsmA protein
MMFAGGFMRRIVIALGIGAAALLLLIAAVLLLVDVNKYNGVIQSRLEQQLRRKVTLGRMSLGLVPLRFQVLSPTIADDPAFANPSPFVQAEQLDVRVALFPLLRGSVTVQSLQLRKPVVELIKNPQGVWNFASLGPEPGSAPAADGSGSSGTFSLDKLEIQDGQIAITDHQAQQARAVYDHIELSLLNYAPGRPFSLDLGTKEIRLKGEGGPIVDANPSATPFHGSLTINRFDVSRVHKDAAGQISGETQIASAGGSLTAKGKLTVDGAQFNKLDLGYPIALDYDVTAKPAEGAINISRGTIQLGATPLSITGSVDSGSKPVSVNLALKSGDVSITEIARLASAFGVAFDPAAQVSGKVAVDVRARGSIEKPALTGTIAGRELQISGKGVPQPVQIKALDLALTPTEIRSNDFDAVSGKTTVNARFALRQYTSSAPLLDLGLRAPNATLPEIQSIASAYGVTGLEQIQGQGALNLDLRAAGIAQSLTSAQAMKALNGTLNLDFSPLSIKGFDAARELGAIAGVGSGEKKDATELLHVGGKILIKDGIAHTDDLRAQLAVGNLVANGTANLTDETLNLKVSSVLSKAYSDKIGGTRVGGYMSTALSNNAGELVIPAIVTGTFKQPKFAPDMQAIVQMQKQRLIPNLADPKSAVSGLVGALTGGTASAGEDKSEKPSVKGLLGGLLGRKKGPASPLADTSWQWTKTGLSNGTSVTPKDPAKFVLKFAADGRLSSTTDCNSASGSYTASESKLAVESLAFTKMFCQGSQESAYGQALQSAESFAISGDSLSIRLKGNSGTMMFKRN